MDFQNILNVAQTAEDAKKEANKADLVRKGTIAYDFAKPILDFLLYVHNESDYLFKYHDKFEKILHFDAVADEPDLYLSKCHKIALINGFFYSDTSVYGMWSLKFSATNYVPKVRILHTKSSEIFSEFKDASLAIEKISELIIKAKRTA